MSAESRVESYAALAARIHAAPPRLGPVRLVAVDGFAGAGKTVFAGRLGTALGAQVVHTDDLLAGWADIVSFWPRLEESILAPLRAGKPGRYRRYDWERAEFAEWHDVPVAPALVLEGVTSARAAIRSELTLSIWVDAPKEVRTRRGIERDGEQLLPLWRQWQRDEEEHEGRDGTRNHVDLIVDGAPTEPHDPELTYLTPPSW
jgi:uridine kinase